MTGLRHIQATCNDTSLPDSFGLQLAQLEVLVLRIPGMTSLPASIGFLRKLRVLQLLECKDLQQLQDSLGSLSCLTELVLKNCERLTCLPDSLAGLTALQQLTLTGISMYAYNRTPMLSLAGVAFGSMALQTITMEGCGLAADYVDMSGATALQRLQLDKCCMQVRRDLGGWQYTWHVITSM